MAICVKKKNYREDDTITWRFTTNEKYSTRSAYEIQHRGSYTLITNGSKSERAKIEPKCKIFRWHLLHWKLPTASWSNHQIKCRGQPNPICQLCHWVTYSSCIRLFLCQWYLGEGGDMVATAIPGNNYQYNSHQGVVDKSIRHYYLATWDPLDAG